MGVCFEEITTKQPYRHDTEHSSIRVAVPISIPFLNVNSFQVSARSPSKSKQDTRVLEDTLPHPGSETQSWCNKFRVRHSQQGNGKIAK
jgi:hypothetical protein